MNGMIILKIKDRKYGMRKMPPIQGAAFGIKVGSALSKMLSGKDSMTALTGLQKKFSGGKSQEDIKKEMTEMSSDEALTFGQIIVRLIANVDPVTVTEIFKEAFSYEVYCGTTRLSDNVSFDEHFRKFPGDLYPVAVWATYNHVKDFFIGLGDGIQAFMNSSETSQSALQ